MTPFIFGKIPIMADLNEQQSAQTVKITGSDSIGVEDNYLNIDTNGQITVNQGDGGVANWLTNIAAFGGSAVSLGQTVMANSIPVTLASNQSSIPVTQSGTWDITNISGTVSLPTNAATETSLNKLTIAQGTALGSNTQILIGGSVTTSVPSYTNGQISPFNLTPSGLLRVDISNSAAGLVNQGSPAAGSNAWPTLVYDIKTDRSQDISLTGAAEGADTWRLCGGNHADSTLDTEQWTITGTGTGAGTVSGGVLDLSTGVTANSTVRVDGAHDCEFTSGQVNNYLGGHRVGDTGTVNNTRRWGAFTATNGVFFQLSGTTFSVVVRNNSSDTVINSGSFNGISSTYSLDTNFHIFEIQYTAGTALFIIDRVLIHKYTATTTQLTSNMTFRIRAENSNSGGGTSNVHLYNRGTSISRLGTMQTVRIAQSVNDLTQVQIVKAIITGRKTDGSYVNAAFDDTGRLIVAPQGSTATTSGFTFGAFPSTGNTLSKIEATTYTEQSSNAQRSLVSTNANDTSAGTGARTVKITYLKSDGSGPFTDTVTMNGTTAVNTTATDICFIEKMEVITVGSNGTNVGTINLKASTGGGGATIGSIGVNTLSTGGDGRTLWAHHYVPAGKTMHITSALTGHGNNTSIGSGGVFHLRSLPIGVSNAIELQITDFIHQFGQDSSTQRSFDTPIDVVGPARVTAFVQPDASLTVVYLFSWDFYED